MSTPVQRIKRLRAEVEELRTLITDVWRWSTDHLDHADAIDVGELRRTLSRLDPINPVHAELDRLLDDRKNA